MLWVILIAALILYPVWVVVPTTLVHGGYAPRYAMPCVLGLSIGMSFALSRTLIRPALRALVVALVATVGWHEATTATGLVRHPGPPETPVDRLNARFLKYDASMPVVISSGIDYLPIAHYGRNATHQYVLLVKPDAALSWMGTDSVDINSLVLQRFLRLHVADADTFVREHPRFYIFASRNNFAWIQRYFASSSTVHLSLLEHDDSAEELGQHFGRSHARDRASDHDRHAASLLPNRAERQWR